MPKKLTTEKFIKKSNFIHNNFYDYSEVKYINSHTKVKIICPRHGIFYQRPYCHANLNHSCPKCKSCYSPSTEEFVNKSNKIHNFKYNYKKTIYKTNHTKVKIICPIHGEFKQSPHNHILEKNGCPKCSKNKQLSVVEFINKSNIIHNNTYSYDKVIYKNNKTKVIITCKIHGDFLQTPHNHLGGQTCPKCAFKISNLEEEFLNFLDIKNRRINLHGKFVDGYDKNENIVYEFLGDYFHGNPNKYNKNEYNNKCKKTFGELYENTFSRFDFLTKFGYIIKYIWESDWNNFKKGLDNTPKILTYE